MNAKMMNRIFGLLAFIIALVVYSMTVQPVVPFWDCGEFSAASIWQQVPHPPGAPLFLMLGKMFHMLIPFGDPGWRVNMLSVTASAVTVWFIYHIIVMAINNFRKDKSDDLGENLAVAGSGFVGALALVFSDTFWFNAVESEVYAMSSLFVGVVVYLMMKWNEEADNPGHERYLLLIAYLMGLSTGVHLLAILAIFSIVFVVYFRKYKFSISSFILTGVISMIIFFIIYPAIVKWIPAMLGGHLPFKNQCNEYLGSESPVISFLVVAVIIAAIAGLIWGYKNRKHTLNLITMSFLLMMFGYSTYATILLRSNANPPMNENEPRDLKSLTAYLGREQYGNAPFWPRRYHHGDEYYTRHYTKRDADNEYIYGPWSEPGRERVDCKDGAINVPKYSNRHNKGEFAFLWKYQIDHMYLRYLGWNFIGRQSDKQDAKVAFLQSKENTKIKTMNHYSGYKDEFPVRFFALPLIIGLIGMFFHFYRDPKMAFVYMTMFLMMGVFTAIFQNQQEPQPRERDYFYAGSFFVFCIWIGMAVFGILKSINMKKLSPGLSAAVTVVLLLAVPFNMAVGGWKIHSRAGNYLPFDYSYNILQSCDENAIIFTNGDNDTFPVWYLQDVHGVRRDVRIVNLSLANTLWYVDQLKNRQPWGAEKIPLSFSDNSIGYDVKETDPTALSYDLMEAQNLKIPVSKDILAKYTNNPAIINSGMAHVQVTGKPYGQMKGKDMYLFRVQDKVVLDILKNTKFQRPVYYSITVGPDAYCGLENYFRYEGMARRICPVLQTNTGDMVFDEELMSKSLLETIPGDDFHLEKNYGFKLRNLNNPDVYYDEVHRRYMTTYRQLYMGFAQYLSRNGKKDKAVEVLNKMNEMISLEQFPMDLYNLNRLTLIYDELGDENKTKELAYITIEEAEALIENPNIHPELIQAELFGRAFGPYQRISHMYELMGEWDKATEVLDRLNKKVMANIQAYGTNASYQKEVQSMQFLIASIEVSKQDIQITKIEKTKGTKEALLYARNYQNQLLQSNDQLKQYLGGMLNQRINELSMKLTADTSIAIAE